MCDCVLFYLEGSLCVAVVELKSGFVDAEVAQQQIKNGSRIAARIIGSERASNFLPILLHRGIRSIEVKMLRKARVAFQSNDYRIIIERYGSQLKEIMQRHPPYQRT